MDKDGAAKPRRTARKARQGTQQAVTGLKSGTVAAAKKKKRPKTGVEQSGKRAQPLLMGFRGSDTFVRYGPYWGSESINDPRFGDTGRPEGTWHLPPIGTTGMDPGRKLSALRQKRIGNAMTIIATLLERDETYLPIFIRLEAELSAVKSQNAALDRARLLLRSPD
jgi:hypothetical protein